MDVDIDNPCFPPLAACYCRGLGLCPMEYLRDAVLSSPDEDVIFLETKKFLS